MSINAIKSVHKEAVLRASDNALSSMANASFSMDRIYFIAFIRWHCENPHKNHPNHKHQLQCGPIGL